ncbi:signal recognition particle-docking protein FtsY [Streptococcus didelphis]|uniref:signal recognition particle-docking protein FtsY n=1 Tax=Streptococcus didelphis TaxID=102886 RepID=UPI000365A454|nr:signal recognition particle-docking protein FtsY [Streptococcus didelphis]
MGLFDRLFGNKKDKDKAKDQEEIDAQDKKSEADKPIAEQEPDEPILPVEEPKEQDFSISQEQEPEREEDQELALEERQPEEVVDSDSFSLGGMADQEPSIEDQDQAGLLDQEVLPSDIADSADTDFLEKEEEPVLVEDEEAEQEKYDRSLKKTRTGFAARLNSFFANFRSVDEEFFEDLEEMLILSDVGVTVATRLTEELRQEAKLENAKKTEDLKRLIIEKLIAIYEKDGVYKEAINYQQGLTVMLFVGVNGVGKTTSIGKLAYRYKQEGKKVMLVAADTFRAGAVAQLVEWGRRVDVPVVVGPEKADPASVVFDGVERAVAEGMDILLIDTAGRLQNKENLMAELEKMGRIIKRVLPDAPHETLLALDASTGQNALSQAKEFAKIMPLSGLILTKIDGTAKGGVVMAIRQELDIPVKFIGFGEKMDDIGEFDSEEFMKGLLSGLL